MSILPTCVCGKLHPCPGGKILTMPEQDCAHPNLQSLGYRKPALPAPTEGALFRCGPFTSHSGLTLPFKIDCDALSDSDLECLAAYAAEHLLEPYRRVVGVPTGGLRFAKALEKHIADGAHMELIVDDVLTTGASMEEARLGMSYYQGVVIFARGPCPSWITSIFSTSSLITAREAAVRESCANACHEIAKDAERAGIKWHEKEGDYARRYEAREIHFANGAHACIAAIRAGGQSNG